MVKFSVLIEYLEYLKERDKVIKTILLLSLCSVTLPVILHRIKFFKKKKGKNCKVGISPVFKGRNNVNRENTLGEETLNGDTILNDLLSPHWLLHGLNPIDAINATVLIQSGSDSNSDGSDSETVQKGSSGDDSDGDSKIPDASSDCKFTKKQLDDKFKKTRDSDVLHDQTSIHVSQPGSLIDKSSGVLEVGLFDSPPKSIDLSGHPAGDRNTTSDPQQSIESGLNVEPSTPVLDLVDSKSSETNFSQSSIPIIEEDKESLRIPESGSIENYTKGLSYSAQPTVEGAKSYSKHDVDSSRQSMTSQQEFLPETPDVTPNLVPSPTDSKKFYSTDATGRVTVYRHVADDEYLEEDKSLGDKGKRAASSIHVYRKRSSKTKLETDSIKPDEPNVKASTDRQNIGDVGTKGKLQESAKHCYGKNEKQMQIPSEQSVPLNPTSNILPSFTIFNRPYLDDGSTESSISSTSQDSLTDSLTESDLNSDAEKSAQKYVSSTCSKNSSNSDSSVMYIETVPADQSKEKTVVNPEENSAQIPQIKANKTVTSVELSDPKKRSHSPQRSTTDDGHKKQKMISESNESESKTALINPHEDVEFEGSGSIEILQERKVVESPTVSEPTRDSVTSSDSSIDATKPYSCPLPSFSFFKHPSSDEKTVGDLASNTKDDLPDDSKLNSNDTDLKDISPDTSSKNGSSSDSGIVYLETLPSNLSKELKNKDPISSEQKSRDKTSGRETDIETSEESVDPKCFDSPNEENESSGQTGNTELVQIQSEIGSSNTNIGVESEESSSEVKEIPQELIIPQPIIPIVIEDSVDTSNSNTDAIIQFLTKDFDEPPGKM